jgi:hypothetical protein
VGGFTFFLPTRSSSALTSESSNTKSWNYEGITRNFNHDSTHECEGARPLWPVAHATKQTTDTTSGVRNDTSSMTSPTTSCGGTPTCSKNNRSWKSLICIRSNGMRGSTGHIRAGYRNEYCEYAASAVYIIHVFYMNDVIVRRRCMAEIIAAWHCCHAGTGTFPDQETLRGRR